MLFAFLLAVALVLITAQLNQAATAIILKERAVRRHPDNGVSNS